MDQVDNLNPKFTKAKEEDKIVVMIDAIMISKIIKIDIGQILETGHYGQDRGRPRYEQNIEVEILEVMQEHIKILEDRIVEESTEIIIEMKGIAEIEVKQV